MGVSPAGGSDGKGVITGDGYLNLRPEEHICTDHYDQSKYGPLPERGVEEGSRMAKQL